MPLISDSIGRVLGKRYRLLSALGTGSSAHVYPAEDVSLQRHVAVKVLQPGLAADEAFLKRFRAEARSVASLNHPHVLRVFDWGEEADEPYLVLEYLGGGSLRDLLDRDVRLSHAQAAQLGAEVAQGLAYAHVRGLVHRDIKPANLLVRRGEPRAHRRLRRGPCLGGGGVDRAGGGDGGDGPVYLAGGRRRQAVDGRADVYSLALVLYEAVTGSVPFVTDTTMGTLAAQDRPDVAARPPAGAARRRAGAGGGSRRERPTGRGRACRPGSALWPRRCRRRNRCRWCSRTSNDRPPIAGFHAPKPDELTDSGVAAGGAAPTTVASARARWWRAWRALPSARGPGRARSSTRSPTATRRP